MIVSVLFRNGRFRDWTTVCYTLLCSTRLELCGYRKWQVYGDQCLRFSSSTNVSRQDENLWLTTYGLASPKTWDNPKTNCTSPGNHGWRPANHDPTTKQLTNQYSPYSPDLALDDFLLFLRADILIRIAQIATTTTLRGIAKNCLVGGFRRWGKVMGQVSLVLGGTFREGKSNRGPRRQVNAW